MRPLSLNLAQAAATLAEFTVPGSENVTKAVERNTLAMVNAI